MNIARILAVTVLFSAACGDSGNTGGNGGTSEGGGPDDGGAPEGGAADGGGGSSDGGADATDPSAQFYEDFLASRYSKAVENASALDAFMDENPDAGDPAIVRGLSHLWHLAEFGRDPSDPSGLNAEGAALLGQFQQARDNNPDDGRVPCWLGLTQVLAGRQIGNADLVEDGLATVEEGVGEYPEFNLFCKALAYAPLPASDPDFALAADALFENLDVCFGESVDRENPDITPYLEQATSSGIKRVCWNTAVAPHGAEGFYLFFGDVLVKGGDLDRAAIMYENAQRIAEYEAWPFKSLVEERLEADLDARAALYTDEDLMNDPPIAGDELQRGCTYCHASTTAE